MKVFFMDDFLKIPVLLNWGVGGAFEEGQHSEHFIYATGTLCLSCFTHCYILRVPAI